MIHHDVEKELAGIAVVILRLRLWSATRKLNVETELEAAKGQLPPTTLATGGEIRLVDPARMRWRAAHRKALERIIRQYGTRSLAGDLVPLDQVDSLKRDLKVFEDRVRDDIEEFAANLKSYQDEWREANPSWSHLIHHGNLDIRQRCEFTWSIFRPAPLAGEDAEAVHASIARTAAVSVANEVAQAASEAYGKTIKGKDKVQQSSLNALRKIARKLQSFALVDPILRTAADIVTASLAKCPSTGPIAGSALTELQRVTLWLTASERILDETEALPELSQDHSLFSVPATSRVATAAPVREETSQRPWTQPTGKRPSGTDESQPTAPAVSGRGKRKSPWTPPAVAAF